MMLVPQDILTEILLRLPVKALARFKCVSKTWLSLISNPYFAQSHFDLALAPTHTILLSLNGTLEIASIDFNAPSIHDYTTKLLKPPFQRPVFIGSCRGFILFQCASGLCIWNPCTGLQRRIPSPPSYVIPGCGKIRGFGYDSSTDDYLVTIGCYDDRGAESRVIVAFFSVRTNTWKQQFDVIISETLNYSAVDFYLGGLFFNGANHWIARVNKASAVDVIVAFDLTERVLFEIALPDGLDTCDLELRVMGGFLSVCPCMLDDCDDEIWVMEEYKVQSSWKSLRFITPDLPYCLLPIYLNVAGDFVGIDEYFTKLVKLNCKGEELECRDYDDFPNPEGARCVVAMHAQSLLSLPYHSLQAEDENITRTR